MLAHDLTVVDQQEEEHDGRWHCQRGDDIHDEHDEDQRCVL
jgi:hypothetical protein